MTVSTGFPLDPASLLALRCATTGKAWLHLPARDFTVAAGTGREPRPEPGGGCR